METAKPPVFTAALRMIAAVPLMFILIAVTETAYFFVAEWILGLSSLWLKIVVFIFFAGAAYATIDNVLGLGAVMLAALARNGRLFVTIVAIPYLLLEAVNVVTNIVRGQWIDLLIRLVFVYTVGAVFLVIYHQDDL